MYPRLTFSSFACLARGQQFLSALKQLESSKPWTHSSGSARHHQVLHGFSKFSSGLAFSSRSGSGKGLRGSGSPASMSRVAAQVSIWKLISRQCRSCPCFITEMPSTGAMQTMCCTSTDFLRWGLRWLVFSDWLGLDAELCRLRRHKDSASAAAACPEASLPTVALAIPEAKQNSHASDWAGQRRLGRHASWYIADDAAWCHLVDLSPFVSEDRVRTSPSVRHILNCDLAERVAGFY